LQCTCTCVCILVCSFILLCTICCSSLHPLYVYVYVLDCLFCSLHVFSL
jgi:hypothetical protein